MLNNSQAHAKQKINKKRKYSNNSDTDSGISVGADISLVRNVVRLSPVLGKVVEPTNSKKTKMPPKLKQTSVHSFFGKYKPPVPTVPKPYDDDDVVVLEVKNKTNNESSKKRENEDTVIILDKEVVVEKPSVYKEERVAITVPAKNTVKKSKRERGLRYDRMVNQALKHLNTHGEGCSKLEILVYILRKFRPSEDIGIINEKLGNALDHRVKKGTLLSNSKESVIVKPKTKFEPPKKFQPKTKFQKAVAVNKKWIKKESTSPKTAQKKEPEKQKKEAAPKAKVAEVQKPLVLNPALAIICRAKKLTKPEVAKKVWTYIKTNNLRDPQNKLIIRCDKNLKKLTKLKTIPSASLMAHIKQSLIPDDIADIEHAITGDGDQERADGMKSFVEKVAQGVYKCRECGYASTRNYNIEKHAEVHMSPDHYKCPICQEVFGKKVNFKFHMRSTHRVNMYTPKKKQGIEAYTGLHNIK